MSAGNAEQSGPLRVSSRRRVRAAQDRAEAPPRAKVSAIPRPMMP